MKVASLVNRERFIDLLNIEFKTRVSKNSQYSLRAFAKSLDFNPASLSLILRGKRKFSNDVIKKIGSKIGLSDVELERFTREINLEEKQRELLSIDTFEICSKWYYDAIIELFKLQDFEESVGWITEVLDIKKSEVEIALERLERVGILEKTKLFYKLNTIDTELPVTELTSRALKEFQKKCHDLSKEAVDNIEIERRYHAVQTMAFNIENMEEAKTLLRKIRQEVDLKLSTSRSNDIYQLNISFYPVTKINNGSSNE